MQHRNRSVSAAGWYPDPGGEPGRFRHWDGSRWSAQTSADPGGPPPPGGAGDAPGVHARRRRGLVVVLIVVALVAGLFLANGLRRDRDQAVESTDSSTPTVSAWNETEAPTPSVSSMSTPNPSGGRSVDCDKQPERSLPTPTVSAGRLQVDRLSMPVPPSWRGPLLDGRMPFARDTASFQLSHPEEALGWASSMTLGVTTFPQGTSLDQMAVQLTQCIITSAFYTSVDVTLNQFEVTPTKVSGRDAVSVKALFTFEHPRLTTKGSAARIVLVQVDESTVQVYFGVTPKEKAELVALIETTAKDLRVS